MTMGVKAGRDQHELRGELARGRQDHMLEYGQPDFRPGAPGHGNVNGVAEARPGPRVAYRAGSGKQAELMNAREQHVRPAPENVRSAIPMVDVPVEDQDPPNAELTDGQLGGDRDVVE